MSQRITCSPPLTNVTHAATCVDDPSVRYQSPSLVSLMLSSQPPSPSTISRSQTCKGNKAIHMCTLLITRALNYSDFSPPTRIKLPSTRILSTSYRKAQILLLKTSLKARYVILPAESGKILISSNTHRYLKILFLIIVLKI